MIDTDRLDVDRFDYHRDGPFMGCKDKEHGFVNPTCPRSRRSVMVFFTASRFGVTTGSQICSV
jgi:hypothetical protein